MDRVLDRSFRALLRKTDGGKKGWQWICSSAPDLLRNGMALELKLPPETLAVDKPAVSYIQLIKDNSSEIKAAVCKVYNWWTFNHRIMSKKPLIKILFLTGFSFPSCLHLFSGLEISSTSCSAQLLFFFLLQSNISSIFFTQLWEIESLVIICE